LKECEEEGLEDSVSEAEAEAENLSEEEEEPTKEATMLKE